MWYNYILRVTSFGKVDDSRTYGVTSVVIFAHHTKFQHILRGGTIDKVLQRLDQTNGYRGLVHRSVFKKVHIVDLKQNLG